MIIGYNIMYSGELLFFLGEDNTTEAVLVVAIYIIHISDHFSSCICSNSMFDYIRCSCRTNETFVLIILCSNDKFHIPNQAYWKWGGGL